MYFGAAFDFAGKADLSKGYCNPKRNFFGGVSIALAKTHFSHKLRKDTSVLKGTVVKLIHVYFPTLLNCV